MAKGISAHCLPPVTITDSNQHGAEVLSLDMPLLKKFIMITWPTVPEQLECQGFAFVDGSL